MIRERRHRLPRECYVGVVTAMFTLCIRDHKRQLVSPATVEPLIAILARAVSRYDCIVPIYTFMPDHLHLLVRGTTHQSDGYGATVAFRRYLGMWHPDLDFQKGFYDRILRWFEGLETEAWYIANNPVRKKFVTDVLDWPFTGAIGCDVKESLWR